jgi:thiol:disulfide interchange protein
MTGAANTQLGKRRDAPGRVAIKKGRACNGGTAWVISFTLLLLSICVAGAEVQRRGEAAPVNAANDSSEPLSSEQAFPLDVTGDSSTQITLHWRMPKGYYLYRDRIKINAANDSGVALGEPQWPQGSRHQDPQFGDVIVYFGKVDVPIAVRENSGGERSIGLRVRFQGCLEGSVCYPPVTREISIALPPADTHSSAAEVGATPGVVLYAGAIMAALLGGLLLNLMPCVLPILSLKILALLNSPEGAAATRRHARYYTAGVIVSFAVLGLGLIALRAAGHALGWGFQLQQPIVLGSLAFVMVAVGLSLSGVVQFGVGITSLGGKWASRSGRAGDFFTGALACIVAAPCTAPFMGSALALALAAPVALALVIFVALGLGLASPFLLMGYFPALRRWLPRPGAWMDTLKQVLAFPMYLTAVWLFWVFGKQRGIDAMGLVLIGAVILGLGLWCLERSRNRSAAHRVLASLVLAGAVLPLYAASTSAKTNLQETPSIDPIGSVHYSPETLAELRRRHSPVFLDVSADWCITCKVNERTVLAGAEFRALLARTGTVYVVANYTDVSPMVASLLDRYHAVGVPLYLAFPKAGGEARTLPAVLTAASVRSTIEWAAR